MYSGKSIRVTTLGDGLYELCFDRQGESINKFDIATHAELAAALADLKKAADLKGLLISSAKKVFIVGADIFEFVPLFKQHPEEITDIMLNSSHGFAAFEELPVPIVCEINGYALGGGFEIALVADYRVMSSQAQVGFPEVTLGIIPGYGGTVRLPRAMSIDCGLETSLEWITSGAPQTAVSAAAAGAVDVVAEPDALRATAMQLLKDAVSGKADWCAKRAQRLAPRHSDTAAVERVRAGLGARPNLLPAATAALESIARSVSLPMADALATESRDFAAIAKTEDAARQVQKFIDDQEAKRKAKEAAAKKA
jgi:3-hydroxyacyl-CoA dehydrogenase / enoyl-CoA hydratase / 3-hydroxybutyryl-CoA epimerase / enoyl-CoA isomerase